MVCSMWIRWLMAISNSSIANRRPRATNRQKAPRDSVCNTTKNHRNRKEMTTCSSSTAIWKVSTSSWPSAANRYMAMMCSVSSPWMAESKSIAATVRMPPNCASDLAIALWRQDGAAREHQCTRSHCALWATTTSALSTIWRASSVRTKSSRCEVSASTATTVSSAEILLLTSTTRHDLKPWSKNSRLWRE